MSKVTLLALVLLAFGWWYGLSIVPRLSNHRGYELISVDDRVGDGAAESFSPGRPRRVFLVLVDGLRADAAAGLTSMQRLRAAGICRQTNVSLPTVSRPVYSLISTGLEQDRSGVRNNDETAPAAAESIWQVARASGRRVAGFSELSWWNELFPGGFDRYEIRVPEEDYLVRAAIADEDLVLVHPAYVDYAGHHHGAASREYRESTARVDREIGELLAAVDLERDVVVATADHGHTARGGHGGDQPEVATTLTCWAGRGVVHREGAGVMDARHIGPLVAVLAGLRFPRHMRPGFGEALWNDLAAGLPAAYVADRRAAEARFVAASAELAQTYARARRMQIVRGVLALAIVAGIFGVVAWRRRLGARGTAELLAWITTVVALHVLTYVVLRGSFQTTSINLRVDWIRASLLIGLGAAAAGLALHGLVIRARARMAADQLTLAAVGAGAALVHIAAYGWVLGFPLPGPAGFFFPFFAAAFMIPHAMAALAVALLTRGR